MKAMVWKEFRENFKWAVLAVLVLSLGTLYLLSQANNRYSEYNSVWASCRTMTAIGSPLFATLLGLLQILPEQRRDQWAFLIHRPVSRGVIFGGKVIAGLGLYLLATGIPFALSMWWALTPGHVAMPADWHMVLPGVVDILIGVTCYFAGMLTALRPARWFGSRTFGLAASLLAVFWVTMVFGHAWQALLTSLLCGTLLAITAWGSFTSDGDYEMQPKLARFGLGTVLYGGTVVVTIAAVALAGVILNGFIESRPYQIAPGYQIDRQGRVLLVKYERTTPISATDLSGNPVPLAKILASYNNSQFLDDQELMSPHNYRYDPGYRDPAHYFAYMGASRDNEDSWFYVPAQKRFVGYSRETKQVIGFLGPDGFSPPNADRVNRFESPPAGSINRYGQYVYRFANSVYWIDLEVPRVTQLAQAEQAGEIRGACRVTNTSGRYNPATGNPVADIVAIVIKNQIHIVTEHGKTLFTTPVQFDGPDYAYLTIAATPKADRYFFWYRPSFQRENSERKPLPSHVIEVASTGEVLNRFTLPPLWTKVEESPILAGLSGLAVPNGPLAAFGAYLGISYLLGDKATTQGIDNTLRDKTLVALFIIMAIIGGLGCAALTWCIGQRCAFSKQGLWAWAFGNFWLGIFGVLMLLALRGWPARETCSDCGKKRVVTREHCEHCGTEFPMHQPDGTEIFDDLRLSYIS